MSSFLDLISDTRSVITQLVLSKLFLKALLELTTGIGILFQLSISIPAFFIIILGNKYLSFFTSFYWNLPHSEISSRNMLSIIVGESRVDSGSKLSLTIPS